MSTDIPAQQTFEEKVNSVASAMTQGEDGNWAIPDDIEAAEEVRYAATLEKRRRDTQAAYGKSQQEQKRLASENAKLEAEWAKDVTASVTEEQREELATLKHEDPDAWRTKLNEIEQSNTAAFKTRREEISTKAQNETEIEYRERLMSDFTEANPGLEINDDVIANDLPPRFVKKLESGEYSFSEFLEATKGYLTKGRVIKQEDSPDDLSLGKLPGGSKPEDSAVNRAATDSYKDETY